MKLRLSSPLIVLSTAIIVGLALLTGSYMSRNSVLSGELSLLRQRADEGERENIRLKSELASVQSRLKRAEATNSIRSICEPILFDGSLKVGDRFPHFKARDINGNVQDTAVFVGKVFIVHFTSQYCNSCIKQLNDMAVLRREYGESALVVLNIDVDDRSPDEVRQFLTQAGVGAEYPTVVDHDKAITKHLNAAMLPATVLVDPSGVIRTKIVGWDKRRLREVEEWLALHHKVRPETGIQGSLNR